MNAIITETTCVSRYEKALKSYNPFKTRHTPMWGTYGAHGNNQLNYNLFMECRRCQTGRRLSGYLDCSEDDCELPPVKKGMCRAHYDKWFRRQNKERREIDKKPSRRLNNFGFRLPIKHALELREIAAQRRATLSGILTGIVTQWLEENRAA
jgi:hypothetical protein